jgi:hypothetical protein
MAYWRFFWTVFLLVAGTSFAFITVVVTVKGLKDLREMFSHLRQQQDGLP